MSKKHRILVIPSDHSGVGLYRSISPHLYIAEHYKDDFDVDIIYLNNIPTENTIDFLKQYDLVHIHKALDKKMTLMNMIKFLGIPVIVDVDDYFYLGNDHPMSITAKKEKWHEPIIAHLKAADYVSTTTDIYADVLRKYNKNVLVFPNAIDPNDEQYSPKKNPSDLMRVGIVCGSSHLHDIELMKGIAETAKPGNGVQIVLCGFDTNGTRTTYMPDGTVQTRQILPRESVWFEYEKLVTDNYRYLSKPHKDFLMQFVKGMDDPFVNEPYRRMWTRDINHFATHYQNVDVLLAPLKNNDFNKMKSQLKEEEAGFTHTALIAQDFGPYTIDLTPFREFGGKINPTGTALLVSERKNHKDWAKNIKFLADNPNYLKQMQDNLHNFVLSKYTLEKICAERVKAYKEILEKNN